MGRNGAGHQSDDTRHRDAAAGHFVEQHTSTTRVIHRGGVLLRLAQHSEAWDSDGHGRDELGDGIGVLELHGRRHMRRLGSPNGELARREQLLLAGGRKPAGELRHGNIHRGRSSDREGGAESLP